MPNFSRWLLPLVLLSALPACAAKYSVACREPALGSDADIVVSKTKSGNYLVEMKMTNLAPPDRLDAASTTYVVWFQPKEKPAVKAGALSYDPDDRRGFLEATTPHREFTLLVTLEANAEASEPTDKTIVTQQVRARK